MSDLDDRIDAVRERIGEAARRVGRSADEIEIVAITKGHPIAVLEEAARAGLSVIGENRVVEAEEKLLAAGRLGLRWHLVGHLQRNKAARAVRAFDAIESVDSVRLARKLDAELEKAEKAGLEVLLQVNTSGEAAKSGFQPDALCEAVEEIGRLERLKVTGLMTMAPFTSDEEAIRATFRPLRELLEGCGQVPGFEPRTLSMGMSNDFEIAIEEGSTRVRLGTVLFGQRPV